MRGSIQRGAIAGVIAAVAVAVFFMVVDAVTGEPLRTPSYLANLMMGAPGSTSVGTGTIALYTLFHVAIFVGIGILIAWLLDRLRLRPLVLLGLVVGVLLFDLAFYAALVLRGVDILDALGWPAFLAGNLIGGLALLAYLDLTSDATPGWAEQLRRHEVIREGLIAGLIGGAVVALWFLVVDVTTRSLWFTPAALGSAVFHGARGIAEVEVSALTVAGYTVLHFSAFLLIGLLAAMLATQAERNGVVLLAAVLLLVTFETLFLGLSAIAASWLLAALNGWTILGANLIAALAMGWYLWRAHPGLRAQLSRDHEESDFLSGDALRVEAVRQGE